SLDKSEMKTQDALYHQPYLFLIQNQKPTTSLLHRQFTIPYNPPSTLIDHLKPNQLIPPQKPTKPTQILLDLQNHHV
ncbi:DNA translocase FtsK, partial [Staphylococcus epidermidis]|uniref:DNA translocase FtsK n=1 Tax=Staphylococcus epidermidis TaxID=1282 RepID=UPI001642B5FA